MEQNTEEVVDVVDNADEAAEDSYSDPTLEDFQKERERRIKAEKKLVELKKASKAEILKESETMLESKLAERDFFKENPEFKEYKEQIASYVSNGLTFEQAGKLVKAEDPAFGNRNKAHASSVTGWEAWNSKSVYTASELSKLSQADYNAVKALEKQGKVRIVRS